MLRQVAKDGRVTNPGKIFTAAGGGFLSGGLAGLTLGFGAATGSAATAVEVAGVNAVSSIIGGFTQRRADEALGFDPPADREVELANIAVDAVTSAAFGYGGGRLADNLFPIPNVRRQVSLLRFAHRRSTRQTQIAGAERNARRQAALNSFVGGVASGIPTEATKWVWQWFTSQTPPRPAPQKEIVTSRVCFTEGECTP